ncbi:MAG: putative Glycosyltransferase, family 9 [Candidatus Nitrospira kreftii]|uniref:Putative Glycosyltransferase, family 9 n=1 Tax=Candidatus Nitrospira kreftii TaxID=2652173 RepID=A0A7S8J015_9BACT|nr:MAG: putative Glycosyltransferase, family 9 [Candidatus Nitrospira kreftii]
MAVPVVKASKNKGRDMGRALVIQLARLGDLVQTIPAITALKESHADWDVDLLCPAPLAEIGQLLPGVSAVVKWDGAAWYRRAASVEAEVSPGDIAAADAELHALTKDLYDCAYVINQHPRSILAGALLARENIGAITGGPLDKTLSPWALYIRSVVTAKQSNRIHLADAFCGMCGMSPPKQIMPIRVPETALPAELDPIGQSDGPWVGVLVGAGDRERLVPVAAWERMITECLEMLPASRIVLVGDQHEQERAQCIQESLPPFLLGRVWDTTGRLSLIQLASLLTRCHIVIGADTGPLHLAAAVGTRVIGWYFARAHVHDTGPYGLNHWVWQAERGEMERMDAVQPSRWPITETIALLRGHYDVTVADWSLWESYRDHWGAYYVEAGQEPIEPLQREGVWRRLQPSSVS